MSRANYKRKSDLSRISPQENALVISPRALISKAPGGSFPAQILSVSLI